MTTVFVEMIVDINWTIGGSFELNLANHGSHTAVPTRTLGDRSTGTDIPMVCLPREESRRSCSSRCTSMSEENDRSPDASTSPDQAVDTASSSGMSSKRRSGRPTYVPMPSPRTFPADSNVAASALPSYFSSTHLPPSPLGSRAFPPSSPSIPLVALNVLVVDDDALTRTLMKRMLERMGCDVTTAENGDLALRMILSQESDNESISQSYFNSEEQHSERKFNIVFMDNQMPVSEIDFLSCS